VAGVQRLPTRAEKRTLNNSNNHTVRKLLVIYYERYSSLNTRRTTPQTSQLTFCQLKGCKVAFAVCFTDITTSNSSAARRCCYFNISCRSRSFAASASMMTQLHAPSHSRNALEAWSVLPMVDEGDSPPSWQLKPTPSSPRTTGAYHAGTLKLWTSQGQVWFQFRINTPQLRSQSLVSTPSVHYRDRGLRGMALSHCRSSSPPRAVA
jgi:hypothetical protein